MKLGKWRDAPPFERRYPGLGFDARIEWLQKEEPARESAPMTPCLIEEILIHVKVCGEREEVLEVSG